MDIQSGRSVPSRPASKLAGLAAALIGGVALVGWALDIEVLRSFYPGLVDMKVNTAACFVLSGLMLLLMRGGKGRAASEALALVVLLVASATIAEYLTGRDLGIDELLFRDSKSRKIGLPPGRPSLGTAVAFVLTGVSLVLVGRRRRVVAAQCLTFAAVLIPTSSLLAYLFGERAITLTSPYTSLALNTAVAFALLGAGILSECSEAGPMSVFFAEGPGGSSLRRLLPTSVGSSIVLGFAAYLGARSGFYSRTAGTVLFAVVTTVVLSAAIWWNGWRLNLMDQARRRERDWLQRTLTSIGDAVIATDRRGLVQFLNPVAEDLTGWPGAEAAGRPLADIFRIVHEATREAVENPVAKVLATGRVVGLANHTVLIARDGSETPIDDSAAAIKDDRGEIQGVVLVFHDVGAKRRAERALAESEEMNRRVIESSADCLAVLGLDGRILSMNDFGRRLMEIDDFARCLHADWVGTWPEDSRGPARDALGRARGGQVASFQGFCPTAKGAGKWWDVTVSPVHDGEGRASRLLCVSRDISARMRIEGELRDARGRLESALSAGSIATWTVDIPSNRVVADRNLAHFFAIPPEAAAGAPLRDYLDAIHPDDMDRVTRAVADAAATGSPFSEEYRIAQADRPVRWVVSRGQVERDGEGRPLRLSGVLVDITGRKQAEERVRESEDRYRTLFNSIDEGFSVIEMIHEGDRVVDYRFFEVNPAFEKQTGLTDAVGRTIRELAPRIEDHWFEIYGKVARTGEPVRFVNEAKELGGRWYDVFAFRIGDPGQPKVAVLFSDITGRKRAGEERERLVAQLREADRRKDEFLAMLAHELRNPLAAISNARGVAARSGQREQLDWASEVIARQMKHLTRLIDDLLDVSRITRGKIELRRDRLDATSILESAAATVTPLVQERKHRLEVAIDRGNLWVDADPTRLEQVAVNLLNNAAKYSENGGHILLRARREDGEVVIEVRDRGVGIAPEKLPEMFELFAQGDRSLARSEGGLGIGLTVVKKLVELHGGRIDARSEGPGRGTEFTVRLPAAAPPAAAPRPSGEGQAGSPARKARVLVVDDNVDTARGMARLLKLIGHEVITAHDGPEAIRAAAEFGPEVVLLDIGLPGMDGYEVAQRLRGEETSRDSLIIAASGYGQEEDIRRSLAAGFDHHLIKPIDHDALLKLLASRPNGPA